MQIMLRSLLITLALTTIGAKQRPVADPAVFSGPSGWAVVAGTTRFTATELTLGETLAEQQVKYVRTGVFSEPLVSGGSLAKQTVQSGLPAYAVEMTGYGVGWCTPGGEARDLGARLASTNKEICVFNDPDYGLFRTQGYDGKSPFAASAMTGKYTVLSTVKIKEQPVEFGRTFSIKVTLAKFDQRQVRIDYWFDDGVNRTRLVSHKLKPTASGVFELPIWRGKVTLRPDGARMRAEPTIPVKDELSDVPELRGIRYFSPSTQIILI